MAFCVPTPGSNPAVRDAFNAADKDKSGKIKANEMQAALSSGGFKFNMGTVQKVMGLFDRDRSGELSLAEFEGVHAFVTTMTSGFRARDRDGSGSLIGPEVREALAASGYVLSEPVFQLLMKKHDKDHTGALGFDEYMELSILIGTVRNVFAYYDATAGGRTGAVNFNWDSFCGAMFNIV